MKINNANLKFTGTGKKRSATNYIMLHHAAGNGSVEDVHRWHLANKWIGIGYHFYVRKDGSIWQGRPIDNVGAHCPAVNSKSVAVCFEGNFDNEKMSEIQRDAGVELIAYLKNLYPKATICRHKDFAATACPGENFPYDEIVATKSENTKFYRVRASAKDEKSQVGAYKIYENAVKACPKNYGVYDEDGKELYFNPWTKEDAEKALRQSAGIDEDTGEYDVDGDGKTTAKDARNVSRNVR